MNASAVGGKQTHTKVARVGIVRILHQVARPYPTDVGGKRTVGGGFGLGYLQALAIVHRKHGGLLGKRCVLATVGMGKECHLSVVVVASGCLARSYANAVDVEVTVVLASPAEVCMDVALRVIAVEHKGMVAARHHHGATQRQFVVDGLYKLPAAEDVLLNGAHGVVEVFQGVHGFPFVAYAARGGVDHAQLIVHVAHQDAHGLCLVLVVIAVAVVGEYVVPVVVVEGYLP